MWGTSNGRTPGILETDNKFMTGRALRPVPLRQKDFGVSLRATSYMILPAIRGACPDTFRLLYHATDDLLP